MSILQNYEKHTKLLGRETILAIDDYINELEEKGIKKSYSDIVYKQKEFEEFRK